MSNFPSYLDYDSVPNNYFVRTKRADGSDPYANERDLFSLWVTESINKFGVAMTYYVVDFDVNYDKLQGEDPTRKILRSFGFMGMYSLDQAAESKLWSRFGIEGLDDITCHVSKKHFDVVSQYGMDKDNSIQYPTYNPRIGDFVRSVYNNGLMEITDVKEETGLYLQSKQHVWSLTLKAWRNEQLDVTPSTSADMPELTSIIDTTDPFDVKGFVTSAAPEIEYTPKPTEKSDDSFWS